MSDLFFDGLLFSVLSAVHSLSCPGHHLRLTDSKNVFRERHVIGAVLCPLGAGSVGPQAK